MLLLHACNVRAIRRTRVISESTPTTALRRDKRSVQKGRYKLVAFRKLTLKQQLKGVYAALSSPRTPKQLKAGLKKRAKQLRKQIDKKRTLWSRVFED